MRKYVDEHAQALDSFHSQVPCLVSFLPRSNFSFLFRLRKSDHEPKLLWHMLNECGGPISPPSPQAPDVEDSGIAA
jgi:hypothetical protein